MTYFMFLYKFADQAVILFLKWRGYDTFIAKSGPIFKWQLSVSSPTGENTIREEKLIVMFSHIYFLFCTTYYNCVSNKMLEYDMLLTSLIIIYGLIGCLRSKLYDLTCPITNICNWTGQIGQLRRL